MCVCEPVLVLAVNGDTAVVRLRGAPRSVPLILVTAEGQTVSPGDWLLVQTGLAVASITAREAVTRLRFLRHGADLGADHESP